MRNEQSETFLREKIEIERIANQAVMKAKEENKRFGIPEFFSKNGVIYYVLEDGNITTERPEILKDKA
ncbi:MAG: hypothetical protein HY842_12440 [Bacteroidetes bacterium]|nr:hypothetical protein [Bacteroidota bacterium]